MRAAGLEGLQKLVLPDRWQADAVAALRAGRDVVLDAPTGAGKTFVFEKFVEGLAFGRPALFTVPTRALANDKFAEWRARGWPVGIATGDVTVAADAPVVVATLEAVQAALLAGARFATVAIDEYQWLGDAHRGNHYEGVIAGLPAGVQLLLLSGSVSNPDDVAAWLRRLGRTVELVRHRERPVPLEEIDADDLVHGLPAAIQGFWARRLAGALREGLGPVLVFAPQRQDAERLARQFAREVPSPDPLPLTAAQEQILGPALAKLVRARVAYHHSGLSYLQRAGVIEPLAKGGQLRAVVATLGLSAGINFSLRSVMITASHYRHDQLEHPITPAELLQMIGRAGRRGLDETGYVLVSAQTPRMGHARPERLKRAAPLPWQVLLRRLRAGDDAVAVARETGVRFFTDRAVSFGVEITGERPPDAHPCGQRTDTGRARLVRRERRPFAGCTACRWRAECLALDPQPTLLWLWQRLGVLDRELLLTARGEIVAAFTGPEGLALAAAIEDPRYPVDQLVFDAANLFAGDRFSGTNPRRLGRLAAVAEKAYRRFTVDGFLDRGVPPGYGWGAAEVVRGLVADGARLREVLEAEALAGRGDVDRLLTEWRSLLKQIAAAPALTRRPPPEVRIDPAPRWAELQAAARAQIDRLPRATLPELPPLMPDQRRPVVHRLMPARGFAAPAFTRSGR